jgi:enediyne polyketide synthase
VTSLVVAGRSGTSPALALEGGALPLLRFLEQSLVDYPGIELVADATLTAVSDPYVADHAFRGERLFPAVLGQEAMAQAAMAVLRASESPVFEDVQFDRPIVVPAGEPSTIRLAALVSAPGRVEVALRSAATAFQLDHFRASCRFGAAHEDPRRGMEPAPDRAGFAQDESPGLVLDPRTDLYGRLLFQDGRFRRLTGYRRLEATACAAEIAATGVEPVAWFHRYLPDRPVLGDPAAWQAHPWLWRSGSTAMRSAARGAGAITSSGGCSARRRRSHGAPTASPRSMGPAR